MEPTHEEVANAFVAAIEWATLTVVLDTNTIISAIGWGGKPWGRLRFCACRTT